MRGRCNIGWRDLIIIIHHKIIIRVAATNRWHKAALFCEQRMSEEASLSPKTTS